MKLVKHNAIKIKSSGNFYYLEIKERKWYCQIVNNELCIGTYIGNLIELINGLMDLKIPHYYSYSKHQVIISPKYYYISE